MELVSKRLKIWIGVMASRAENEIGNQFYALQGVILGCEKSHMECSARSVKFWIGFVPVFVTIVIRGELCVDSMIQWREGEKEKD
jgi:hypothetical protein